jgi:signal transduction histidine kinase
MRVAHDLNNLLFVIRSSAEILRRRLADGDARSRECLDDIVGAGDRAAEMARQLLASGADDDRPVTATGREATDVNRVISGVVGLLRRLVGPNVRLALELSPGVAEARVAATHLERILMNLAANARDAMRGAGELRVATQMVTAAERPVALDGRAGDRHLDAVLVTVADTGCGMSDETRRHIFDAFFTTKAHGGNGLGLATVGQLVTGYGGFIEVDSEVGVGSTFRVYLPRLPIVAAGAMAGGAEIGIR